jgi:hypothetical protein
MAAATADAADMVLVASSAESAYRTPLFASKTTKPMELQTTQPAGLLHYFYHQHFYGCTTGHQFQAVMNGCFNINPMF